MGLAPVRGCGLQRKTSPNQKYLNFRANPQRGKAAEKFGRQKQWGGPPCPPLSPSLRQFVVGSDSWRARRPAPLSSNFKQHEFVPAHHSVTNKSELKILTLEVQAPKARIFLGRFFGKCYWLSAKRVSRAGA